MSKVNSPNRPQPSRVVLVDDHPLFRFALKQILTQQISDLEVVAEATDGLEALDICCLHGPHLVLMDLGMPKLDGIGATGMVRRKFPRTAVLVLSAHEDPDLLSRAIGAGACGYVLKTAPPGRIANAVRRALEGDAPLDQELSMRLLKGLVGEERAERRRSTPYGDSETSSSRIGTDVPPLSAREVEVLRLVAKGYTNHQIARGLMVSTSTVKNHVRHVLAKLGASDRTQAAIMAHKSGLLSGSS